MKNKLFQPYGLDMQYEFQTYKSVGQDYGNWKTANLGLWFNLKRLVRKYITNKKEKHYKRCDTYTEWKAHITEILPKGLNSYEDMLHWLYRERRREERFLEAVKAILIPVYIALLGIMDFIVPVSSGIGEMGSLETELSNSGNIWCFIIFIITIVIASTKVLAESKKKVDFYADFISIAEEY